MRNESTRKSHIEQFPKSRIPRLNFLALGDNKHYAMSLIEMDVTDGRQMIVDHERRTRIKLSFTVWLIVTSVGMFAKVRGWAISTASHTLCFAIGGISKKTGIINDEIQLRGYLTMTILFNHDVVDGGPLARFVSQLVDLM